MDGAGAPSQSACFENPSDDVGDFFQVPSVQAAGVFNFTATADDACIGADVVASKGDRGGDLKAIPGECVPARVHGSFRVEHYLEP